MIIIGNETVAFHVWVRIQINNKSTHFRIHYRSSPWFEVDSVAKELRRREFPANTKFQIIRAMMWLNDGKYYPIKVSSKDVFFPVYPTEEKESRYGT